MDGFFRFVRYDTKAEDGFVTLWYRLPGSGTVSFGSKEVTKIMNERELIDLVIVERIDMLLHHKEEERESCESESLFLKKQSPFSRSSPKRMGIS